MTTLSNLQKPTPERIALSREWQRQFESGEFAAGYWQWYEDNWSLAFGTVPAFAVGFSYHYKPTINHPHWAVYSTWEAHKAIGDVWRHKYILSIQLVDVDGKPFWFDIYDPDWGVSKVYRIRKNNLHPDNQKPKLKLIDFSNVPVGTMTTLGEIRIHKRNHGAAVVEDSLLCSCFCYDYPFLRIIPATKWTAIQDVEKPPVCEGLVIEYRYVTSVGSLRTLKLNSNQYIPSDYRVIGLAAGWTDDPTKVVQS